jgi:hypothetical protein
MLEWLADTPPQERLGFLGGGLGRAARDHDGRLPGAARVPRVGPSHRAGSGSTRRGERVDLLQTFDALELDLSSRIELKFTGRSEEPVDE